MTECHHTWTQGRPGEKGSWCHNCGVKVLEVETRTCEGCEHCKAVFAGSVCKKHLMAVSPDMLVTFKIANGTCWQAKTPNAPHDGRTAALSPGVHLDAVVGGQKSAAPARRPLD